LLFVCFRFVAFHFVAIGLVVLVFLVLSIFYSVNNDLVSQLLERNANVCDVLPGARRFVCNLIHSQFFFFFLFFSFVFFKS
jgi:hypothetical protein